MAENPYQPPDTTVSTAADRPVGIPSPTPLLSLWRRIISVLLITLGALMSLGLLASPVEMCVWLYEPAALGEPGVLLPVVHLTEGLLGVAMIWGGFRLRRMPESGQTKAQSASIPHEKSTGSAAQFRSDLTRL